MNEILKILDPSAWLKLDKFIKSQHLKDSDIYKIFGFYYRRRKKEMPTLSQSEVHATHFDYISYKRFLNLCSELNTHYEDFLLLSDLQENRNRRSLNLNRIYNEKALYKKANREASRLTKELESEVGISDEAIAFSAEVLHQQYYSDNPLKYITKGKMLQELVTKQMVYFQMRSLKYTAEMHSWGRIVSYDYSNEIKLLEILNDIDMESHISGSLRLLLNLIRDFDLDAFLALRAELYSGKFKQGSEMQYIICIYLIQSCYKLWSRNEYNDADENAKLIEYALETEVYMVKGKIPVVRFHNVIASLGTLKDYVWTDEFIERWWGKVNVETKLSTASLARAQNAVNHGKHDLVLEILRGHQFKIPIQKRISQSLELIALYEDRKNNYSVLRSYIPKYKKSLVRQRKNSNPATIQAYLNFARLVEIIIQQDFRKVTISVEKHSPTIFLKWVKSKIRNKEKGITK